MSKFNNKVALVTGGSRGIGAGIVKRLAKEGANVAFTYVNSAEKANALVKEAEAYGVSVLAIQADSADINAIKAAVQTTVEKFGKIDILVNSAGVFITGQVDDPSADISSFDRQLDINVKGVIAAVRAAIPYIPNGGRIISIGSTGAHRSPYPGIGDYVATKAAVAAYTRGWSRDLGAKGITVNTIQPGLIDTDMNPAEGEFSATMLQAVALGHYGKPEDVAGTVSFLASEDGRYITGSVINVDGGQSA